VTIPTGKQEITGSATFGSLHLMFAT